MDQLLSALKAAAEPTRLRLLVLCAHMDLTVSQLTQVLGQSQPRVSRHLKLLLEARLLERQREGSWAFYRLAGKGPAAELGRTLVDSIPADDPVLQLDMERLDVIRRVREKVAADYFRRNAAEWDRVRSLYVEEAEVERQLLALLPEGQVEDLLDIGTGTGRVIEIFGKRVGRAVGIDLSHEMLTVARNNLEHAQLRNCLVQHGDMYKLPVQSAVLRCRDHPPGAALRRGPGGSDRRGGARAQAKRQADRGRFRQARSRFPARGPRPSLARLSRR